MIRLPLVALDHGLPVFPLRARSKVPATAHGFHDATNDRAKIDVWAKQLPRCNWGAALGGGDVFAVDVDPRSGGDQSLRTLLALHDGLPSTLTQATGGGGWHYLYRAPRAVDRWPAKIAPGIDIKARGGYIVVAESIHESGYAYEWLDRRAEIAIAPEWLMRRIQYVTERVVPPQPTNRGANLGGMSAAELAGCLDPHFVRRGGQYFVRCVAHTDSDPSLALRDGDGGRVLWFCHGGCSREVLAQAICEKVSAWTSQH